MVLIGSDAYVLRLIMSLYSYKAKGEMAKVEMIEMAVMVDIPTRKDEMGMKIA